MKDNRKRPPLITIRVTLEERDQLNQRATDEGLSLNQWCRERLGLRLNEGSYFVQRQKRRKARR